MRDFKQEEALRPGVDAEAGEDALIPRLVMARDDHDLHLAGIEHRARPHLDRDAGIHRAAHDPLAVGERAHLAGDRRAARRRGRSTACRSGRRASSVTVAPTPALPISATAAGSHTARDRDVLEPLADDLARSPS